MSNTLIDGKISQFEIMTQNNEAVYKIKNTQIFSTNMSFKKVPFYFTFNKESLFKTKNKITNELLKDLLLKINSQHNIVIKERKFELNVRNIVS